MSWFRTGRQQSLLSNLSPVTLSLEFLRLQCSKRVNVDMLRSLVEMSVPGAGSQPSVALQLNCLHVGRQHWVTLSPQRSAEASDHRQKRYPLVRGKTFALSTMLSLLPMSFATDSQVAQPRSAGHSNCLQVFRQQA